MPAGGFRQRFWRPAAGIAPGKAGRYPATLAGGCSGGDAARGFRFKVGPGPALVLGGLGAVLLPVAAAADPADDLQQLRTEIQKEISALKKQEAKLHQQFLELDRKSKLLDKKSQLLDRELQHMRAAGTGAVAAAPGVGAPGTPATISAAPPALAPPVESR